MQSTATSNGHQPIEHPILTSRAEIRRQVREEVAGALASRRTPRWDVAIRVGALLWLVAALALSVFQ